MAEQLGGLGGLGGVDPRADYIQGLYRDLLGREADPDGLNYWLNSGLDEFGLYDSIYDTPDARRAEVAGLYKDYFGSAGDEAGINYWANSGLDIGDIQRAFYNYPEAQLYLASQYGPYQSWMQPLTALPDGQARTDLQTMADIWRQYGGDNFAAGMMGNVWKESRGVANQLQLDGAGNPIYRNGNPIGFGLMQLSPARRADLERFAQQYGVDPYSAEGQARFHIWELNNTERGRLGTIMKRGVNPNAAAAEISRRFIRPNPRKADLAGRMNAAQIFSDWMARGMPADDEQIRNLMAPLGKSIYGTEPDFLTDQYMNPDTQNNYFIGPGSSYQGQSIDPMTGQWIDPVLQSIYGFLQPGTGMAGNAMMSSSLDNVYQPYTIPESTLVSSSLDNVYQPYTIASSSGVQNNYGTNVNYLSDPGGQTGGWGTSLEPYGPWLSPGTFNYSSEAVW